MYQQFFTKILWSFHTVCVCAWICVHYLVFIIEQFGELRHGACGQLGVVLVVDQMDDGGLEHLGGLGQPLDVGHLGRVCLSGQDGGASLQRLREHRGPHPLGSGHSVLGIQVYREVRWLQWYHGPIVIKAQAVVYAYWLVWSLLIVLPGISLVTVVVVTVYCLEVVNSPSSSLTVVAPDWIPESKPYIVCCQSATFAMPLSGSPTAKRNERNCGSSEWSESFEDIYLPTIGYTVCFTPPAFYFSTHKRNIFTNVTFSYRLY